MTKCNQLQLAFPMVKHRKVEGRFGGGEITSEGGVLLTALADRKIGLSSAIARVLPDAREASKLTHSMRDLLRQRIYAIAQGWEDLNDHQSLRADTALQTAVGRDVTLASASTLCRLENQGARHTTRLMHRVLVETFVSVTSAAMRVYWHKCEKALISQAYARESDHFETRCPRTGADSG